MLLLELVFLLSVVVGAMVTVFIVLDRRNKAQDTSLTEAKITTICTSIVGVVAIVGASQLDGSQAIGLSALAAAMFSYAAAYKKWWSLKAHTLTLIESKELS